MIAQEWLDSNAARAYPFLDDSDFGKLPAWVLLDMRLVDADYRGATSLECLSMTVSDEKVTLSFKYGDETFSIDVPREEGIRIGTVKPRPTCAVSVAMCGARPGADPLPVNGTYSVGCAIDPARVVGIERTRKLWSINGSSGTMVLKDGYNTSASIVDGTVNVSIGDGYGLGRRCPDEDDDSFDCSMALLFVNGQHADTSGNIDIIGGDGVSVQTGRTALVDGKVVPAITISVAGRLKEVL